MNALKESFDQEDIQTLKQFILVELEGQSQFTFPSNRQTSGMNMGQITQIAFELRNLTQQAVDDESSDEVAEEMNIEQITRREEMNNWMKFCKAKIDKIEKVWNKKLEETTAGENSEENEPAPNGDDDDLSNEETINQLLERFDSHRLSRSQVEHRKQDQIT